MFLLKQKSQKSDHGSDSIPSVKRADRVDRTKDREGRKIFIMAMTPDADETSTAESHSETQAQPGACASTFPRNRYAFDATKYTQKCVLPIAFCGLQVTEQ